MKKFILHFKYLLSFFVIASILAACGGKGSCPPSFNGITAMLKNGSIVTIPVSSLNVAPGGTTSTSITLTGGTPGTDVYFTSSVSSTQKTNTNQAVAESIPIQVIITPDMLVTGAISSAAMIIKVINTLAPGTYYIKLFATYQYNGTNVTTQIGIMTIVVGSNSNMGVLNITPESVNVATSGTATLVLTLSNSSNVSNMNVTLASANSSIFTVSPTSCVVSTSQPTCQLTVTGITAGSAFITTTAAEFATQAQASVNVINITEKGIAAFAPSGYGLAFSDTPSNSNWQSYVSGPVNVGSGLPSNAAITSIAVGNNRGLTIAAISGNYTHQDVDLPTTGEILVSKNRGQWQPVAVPGFTTPVTTVLTDGTNFYAYGQDGYKFAGACDAQKPNWHWVCPWWDYNNSQIIWTTDGVNFSIGAGSFDNNIGSGIAGDNTQGIPLTPSAIGNNQILDHQYDYHSTPQGYQTVNGGKNAAVDANGNIWVVSPNKIESNTTTTASVAIYKSSDHGNTFQLESNIPVNTGILADGNTKVLTIQATTIVNSYATQQAQQALIFVSQVFGNGGTTNIYAIPLGAVNSAHTVNVTSSLNPAAVNGFSVASSNVDHEPQVTYSVTTDPTKMVYIVASNFNQYLNPTHIETAYFRVSLDINLNLTVATPHAIQTAAAIQTAISGASLGTATSTPIISSIVYDNDPVESGLIAVDTNYTAGWAAGSTAGSLIYAVGPNGPDRGNNWIQFNPKAQNTNPLASQVFPTAFAINGFNASIIATSPPSDQYNDLYFGDTNSNLAYSPQNTNLTYFMPSGAEQAESQWVGIANNGSIKLMLGANGTLVAESGGVYSALPSLFNSSGVAYPAGYLTGLMYGNGVFVVTTNTNTIYTSSNGTIWSTATIPQQVPSPILNFVNGQFIASSKSTINKTLDIISPIQSNTMYVSSDLVTWNPITQTLPINSGANNTTSNSIFGVTTVGNDMLAYGVAINAVDVSNNLLYPNQPTTFNVTTSSLNSWTSVQESGLQISSASYNPVSYEPISQTIVGLGNSGSLYGANNQTWYNIAVAFESGTTPQTVPSGMSQLVFSGKQYIGIATANGFTANLYSSTITNISNFSSLGFGGTYTNLSLY